MKRMAYFPFLTAVILVSCGGKGSSCGFNACTATITFSPDISINLEQGKTTTVNVTVKPDNGFSGEASLSLSDVPSGVTGSFAPPKLNLTASGTTSVLTLNATDTAVLGTKDVTVAVAATGLSSSPKSLKLNVTGTATIAVAGKVLKFDGSPANGVVVQVEDANGVRQTPPSGVTTQADGSFTVANQVQPPYTISAYLPGTSLTFRPVSWAGVNRSNPQVVLPSRSAFDPGVPPPSPPAPQQNWTTTCNPAQATISGSIPAIAAGNLGYLVFIGQGVSRFEFAFDDPGYSYALPLGTLPAASTSYTLSVPFDRGLCKASITGTLIYIEKTASNYAKAQVVNNVTVSPGLTTTLNLSPTSVGIVAITATLNAPTGTSSASFYPTFKIAGAGGITVHCCGSDFPNPLPENTIVNAGASVPFVLPNLPGIEYRMHMHGSYAPSQTTSYWSSSATSGNVSLDLLNLVGPIAPNGAANNLPTFTYNSVSSATLYQVHVYKTPSFVPSNTTVWTGFTTGTSIKLPQLGQPAALTSGTYYWSVDAISLRGSPSVDDLLDGRMAKRNWNFSNSHYYPEDIIGVSYNQSGTQFIVP